MPYLPYEEPSLQEILSLTSLLLLLNIARYLLDRLLYCGIVGEILIGVIWGLPVGGTAWLSEGVQKTIQAFGYLGLIGLVFEGGLGTEIVMLRKTAFTSVSIATVGLMLPIALSFILLLFPFSTTTGTAYPSPLAAFSAGASLCSTSLGTTFAILSSVNMQKTRTGVILVGAAMMDDVVGLVMVNIVTTLGSGNMAGWPIARPIAASFGLLLVTLLMCHFVLKPIWRGLVVYLDLEVELMSPPGTSSRFRIAAIKIIDSIPHLSFILPTLVLITYITIASFIDASVLFAAFIAGGVVNFLRDIQNQNRGPNTTNMNENTSSKMYDGYFRPAMDFILVPFFFASIGFSIPITDMFAGSIIWKGIAYSLLMAVAKGSVCLVIYLDHFIRQWRTNPHPRLSPATGQQPRARTETRFQPNQPDQPLSEPTTSVENHTTSCIGPPHHTAMLIGFAMISRGEIGFLIASLSQSSGTLTFRYRDRSAQSSGEDIFLVVVWAVVLCTIIGPISVGIVAGRIAKRKPLI